MKMVRFWSKTGLKLVYFIVFIAKMIENTKKTWNLEIWGKPYYQIQPKVADDTNKKKKKL